MRIEELIKEIIPPSDYEHRNGFNNIPLIDKLDDDSKSQLEAALLSKLSNASDKEVDILVVETLAYLKSYKSLDILNRLLIECHDDMTRLAIAVSIFGINRDKSMMEVAINTLNDIESNRDAYYVHKLSSAFYYLKKFESAAINSIIERYANHSEYLISYNAKQILNRQG